MADRGQRSYSHFNVSGDARVHAGDVIHHHDEDPLRKLLRWLDAPDHTSNQYEAQRKREPGTGQWLLQDTTYEEWLNSDVRSLWLHGKAGCCKTITCSTIIDHVAEQVATRENCVLVYFYFSFTDTGKQDYRSLLLSCIAQLLQHGADPGALKAAHDRRERNVTVLEPILYTFLRQYDTAYFVIDGLDEAPEAKSVRQEVLDGLQAVHSQCANCRILISSRKEPDIDECVHEIGASSVSVLDHNVDQDVKRYVSREIARHRKLRTLSESMKTKIATTLSERAGGMFRWAFCQLEHIKSLKVWTDEFIHSTLHELPQTLDETYTRILLAMDPMYHKQVKSVLQWLAFVEQPLRLRELVEICVTDVKGEPYVREEAREAWHAIEDVLSPLIERVHSHNPGQYNDEGLADLKRKRDATTNNKHSEPQIILAHFSIKEYLLSRRISTGPASVFTLEPNIAAYDRAQCCVAYMLHVEARRDMLLSKQPPGLVHTDDVNRWLIYGSTGIREVYPLFHRAAQHWDAWQRQAETSIGQTLTSGLELSLIHEIGPLSIWSLLRWRNSIYNGMLLQVESQRWSSDASAPSLYLACALRLPRTVARICSTKPGEINHQLDEDREIPLTLASESDYGDIVDVLLAAGADVNPSTVRRAPLIAACSKGNSTIVSRLLQAGAEVNCTSDGSTALLEAVRMGFITIVRALLHGGADVNLVGECKPDTVSVASLDASRRCCPLQCAARLRRHDIVVKLIDAGADVNLQTHSYASALHIAARKREHRIVEALIQGGADVNLRAPGSAKVPLQEALLASREVTGSAVSMGLMLTLQELLGARANVELLQPVCTHYREVAHFLRSHGAADVHFHGDLNYPWTEQCIGQELGSYSDGCDDADEDESDDDADDDFEDENDDTDDKNNNLSLMLVYTDGGRGGTET